MTWNKKFKGENEFVKWNVGESNFGITGRRVGKCLLLTEEDEEDDEEEERTRPGRGLISGGTK